MLIFVTSFGITVLALASEGLEEGVGLKNALGKVTPKVQHSSEIPRVRNWKEVKERESLLMKFHVEIL